MTSPENSPSDTNPVNNNEINQDVAQNKGQAIAQMMGGVAVGQLTVYLSQNLTQEKPQAKTPDDIGKNPYQGLKAFRETDGDRFFGRDEQIQKLWEQFRDLHGDRTTIRLLPIYGPSGSGKSSLARAGLIPQLGKQPLSGQDRGRVVSLTPGSFPLEALATVLARIATKDDTPVAKTKEFETVLFEPNSKQEFDGLRRIANVLPDIDFSPLIVLVDQFEELYTLCEDDQVRHALIENLLCAASDSGQRVSVIITMRSDFLGKTQQHPRLNGLFSSQGFLVPIMQPKELELAITEPATQAGYELNQAIVQLLIKESQGQDGALPLLQFALTQIWEGLRNGVEPIDTFKKIGGVGGALANEAKRIYYDLTSEQQTIARCIFLALIQLSDDNKSTRRRAPISELISSQKNEAIVREVIDRFARPGVWILVTFCSDQQVEMLEVAHEALIQNWQELKDWLKEHGEALSKKRKIEQFTDEWKNNNKSKDYLLQGRMLRDAKEFVEAQKDNTEILLSDDVREFIKVSIKKQRINRLKLFSVFLVFPGVGTIFTTPLITKSIRDFQARQILYEDNCNPNPNTREALEYMLKNNYQYQLVGVKLCNKHLPNINLSGSDLSEANLQNANLGSANLQDVFLVKANLKETFMVKAQLNGSVLIQAQMQGTKLQGADLSKTNLTDADLSGADLLDTNINIEQIRTVKKICNARLPAEIMSKYLEDIERLTKNCY